MFDHLHRSVVRTLGLIMLLGAPAHGSTVDDGLSLWPRSERCYLVGEASTPVWAKLPASAAIQQPLELRIKLPAAFRITAFETAQNAYAGNPAHLVVPGSLTRSEQGDEAEYIVALPGISAPSAASLSLMMNPGGVRPGAYAIQFALSSADGKRRWPPLTGTAEVLPRLDGRRPSRLRIQLYSYSSDKSAAYQDEALATLSKTGINQICYMRPSASADVVTQRALAYGLKPLWLWFWPKEKAAILDALPEARRLDADRSPMNELCYAWCIEHRKTVKRALVEYLRPRIEASGYAGLINDNEERAFDSERLEIAGDVATPATLEQFRKHAQLPAELELTARIISDRYRDAWIDFRCWQSAQMSAILSESVTAVDPGLDYGYYSGYKHAGRLAALTRARYATDWGLLGKIGGIRFGTAGYAGSPGDLTATARALAPRPFVPAEMYLENFTKSSAPSPERFSYRLMCALMYGTGGFGIWYQQVLDGAAYAAIGQVTALAADIEDLLLDGRRCDGDLVIGEGFDAGSIMAYELGGKRLVVAFNHGAEPRTLALRWREADGRGETVDLVSGKNFGAAPALTTTLGPRSYVALMTVTDGN
ncbi:hypothetical protein [Opitutus sp. ER46]|uniref:hypothetical protein n=1 Tax=Opitutus sp. ER46 TaxID=2161864 RepID=UPI000D31236C|nr:hypothetical protein [Opitutus sp. ER46]PTY00374.1 hypothetical protein DB354_01830 [Opitutus sp. ER46]